MAHLRKSVNMYFLCQCLGIMLIRFEFYFHCLRECQCMLMILKQRKIKFKPGIEHKDYALKLRS